MEIMKLRLQSLIDSVICNHRKEKKAHTLDIKIPVQLYLKGIEESLGEKLLSSTENRIAMGMFYEGLTQALDGGCLTGLTDILNGVNDDGLRPDVTHNDIKVLRESKATCSGSSCNLRQKQTLNYAFLQYRDPSLRIFFHIWRHNLRKIESYSLSKKQLCKELAEKHTKFLAVLPLSIIMRLYELSKEDDNRLVTRYERRVTCDEDDEENNELYLEDDEENNELYLEDDEESGDGHDEVSYDKNYLKPHPFDSCIRIRSPVVNRLLVEPIIVIRQAGLKVSDYRIRRWLSPSGLTVNMGEDEKVAIAQFPIVEILDKDHKAWYDVFRREYEEERMRVEEPTREEVEKYGAEVVF